MNVRAPAPDTVVLIHGFWVTPRSWEDWKARYESRGYRVLTPAYPGFEVEVEALNADPTPIENLTVQAVGEHVASDPEALLELVELGQAEEGVTDDQPGPAFTDDLEHPRDRARLLPLVVPFEHGHRVAQLHEATDVM